MDDGASIYRRFLDGDENALEELIVIFRQPLTFFINGFVKDSAAAEDIMIDTFVELVRHKGQFKGESSLKTYLFKIGRNKALRHIEQRRSRSFIPLDEVDLFISDDFSLEDEMIRKQRKTAIHNALKLLKSDYREVIYLLYFEDMSYESAAKILGKNKKQISNIAYRAKHELKEILEKEDFHYDE